MAVVVICPRCRVGLHLADDRSGETFVCPKCDAAISIPIVVPTPTEVDWKPGTAPPGDDDEIATPIEETDDRPELTPFYCYDCGQRIYEGDLVRRTVVTGRSETRGVVTGGNGTWRGATVHHGRVDLCSSCSRYRTRSEKEEEQRRAITCLIFVCAVAAILLFLYIRSALLSPSRESSPEPQEETLKSNSGPASITPPVPEKSAPKRRK